MLQFFLGVMSGGIHGNCFNHYIYNIYICIYLLYMYILFIYILFIYIYYLYIYYISYILYLYYIYIIIYICYTYYYIGKLVIKLNQSNHLKTQAKGTTEEALQRLSLATPALVESRDRRGEALVESSIS